MRRISLVTAAPPPPYSQSGACGGDPAVQLIGAGSATSASSMNAALTACR
jgi:hypothetical protein